MESKLHKATLEGGEMAEFALRSATIPTPKTDQVLSTTSYQEKIMPNFLYYILAVVLMCTMSVEAKAVDLTGGDILTKPQQCYDGRTPKGCVVVKKEERHYLVVFDQKGEYAIYEVDIVENDTSIDIKNKRLLWARDMV